MHLWVGGGSFGVNVIWLGDVAPIGKFHMFKLVEGMQKTPDGHNQLPKITQGHAKTAPDRGLPQRVLNNRRANIGARGATAGRQAGRPWGRCTNSPDARRFGSMGSERWRYQEPSWWGLIYS
jgi:hypothetical protein